MSLISTNETVAVTIAKDKGMSVETFKDLKSVVEYYTLHSIAATHDPDEHTKWLKSLRPALTKAIRKVKKAYEL